VTPSWIVLEPQDYLRATSGVVAPIARPKT
jgi:hypothetical protein